MTVAHASGSSESESGWSRQVVVAARPTIGGLFGDWQTQTQRSIGQNKVAGRRSAGGGISGTWNSASREIFSFW